MAPLGILTAVGAVIRVCGGPSIRAFIGKAQEGQGRAEAELCSSTSSDICELWDRGGIARIFGRPKILELVHDRSTTDFYDAPTPPNARGRTTATMIKPTAGLFPFRDYLLAKGDNAEWKEVGSFTKNTNKEETGQDDFAPVPNLSLNVGIKRQSTWILQSAAILGLLLQGSVVAFAAAATYVLELEKDGKPMVSWSFPLTFVGTIALCLGMFACSALIEQMTSERVFRAKPDLHSSSRPKIHWLQPGDQLVADQTFHAFAHSSSPAEYVTSWKHNGPVDTKLNLAVWLSVGCTMSGFMLQFVGLRGMHSSIALFQLAATVTMGVIRASLRTRRLERNDFENITISVHGHELDWLALSLGRDDSPDSSSTYPNGHFWKVDTRRLISMERKPLLFEESKQYEELRDSTKDKLQVRVTNADQSLSLGGILFRDLKEALEAEVVWISKLQQEEEHPSMSEKASGGILTPKMKPHLAARMMKYRARLARLTSPGPTNNLTRPWQFDTRMEASKLKLAIEGSARVIFSDMTLMRDWDRTSTVLWPVPVQSQFPSTTNLIYLTLRRSLDSLDQSWEADESELEAVLGLWVWSLKSNPDTKLNTTAVKRLVALGAVEEDLEKAKLEFDLWARRHTAATIEDLPIDWLSGRQDIFPMESGGGVRYSGWQSLVGTGGKGIDTSLPLRCVSVPTRGSLITQIAQDIYLVFMTAMSAILEDVGGDTNVREAGTETLLGARELTRRSDFVLLNTNLDRVATAFVDSKLGTREDAYMCIMPPLKAFSKLPKADAALNSAAKAVAGLKKDQNWERAEALLKWARGNSSGSTDGGAEKVERGFGELYRAALRSNEEEVIQFGFEGVHSLCKRLHSKECKPSIHTVYSRYGWIAMQIAREIGHDHWLGVFRDILAEEAWVSNYLGTPTSSLLQSVCNQDLHAALFLLGRSDTDVHEIDQSDRSSISWAAEHGFTEVVEALVGDCTDPDNEDSKNRTPLSYAAENGHDDIILLLIENGASLNAKDLEAWTPLHFACAKGHRTAVKNLLSTHRVRIDSRTDSGDTAISLAASHGHLPVVELLVDEGADLDEAAIQRASEFGHLEVVQLLLKQGMSARRATPGSKSTPLHFAAENGHVDVVGVLLQSNALTDAPDSHGHCPLHLAAIGGHSAVIDMLLHTNPGVVHVKDEKKMTPLLLASYRGYDQVVSQLIQANSEVGAVSGDGVTSLMLSAMNGHAAIVQLLIAAGAEFQDCHGGFADGGGPIHWAAGNGHVAVVKLLLEKGISADAKDLNRFTPLIWAARGVQPTVIKFLLENGADLHIATPTNRTVMDWAAESGNVEAVEILLAHGATVNVCDGDGITPLHRAAERGHVEVSKCLLSAGAVIDAPIKYVSHRDDKSEGTPLHWASIEGHDGVADLLIKAGADLEARNTWYRTPLHLACRYGKSSMVQLLVELGADVEARRDTNETPLHFAVEENRKSIVEYLVDKGNSNIEAVGDRGTPLNFAASTGNSSICSLLLNRGASIEARIPRSQQTSLHLAVNEGTKEVVKLLLEKGANVMALDGKGRAAVDIARDSGHEGLVGLLESYSQRAKRTITM